jgi:hypothetical protein
MRREGRKEGRRLSGGRDPSFEMGSTKLLCTEQQDSIGFFSLVLFFSRMCLPFVCYALRDCVCAFSCSSFPVLFFSSFRVHLATASLFLFVLRACALLCACCTCVCFPFFNLICFHSRVLFPVSRRSRVLLVSSDSLSFLSPSIRLVLPQCTF